MVIDSNRVTIFLVLRFVINNHKVRYPAQQSVSFLSPETLAWLGEKNTFTFFLPYDICCKFLYIYI